MPLRRESRDEYLRWAVRAFRLASSRARPETQIHTHMCYSEFGDILTSIGAMDADVISVEDARSDGATLASIGDFPYPVQLGLGVYDIHSPNIPTVEFLEKKLRTTLKHLPAAQVWINPDCGLKTRSYAEVVPALRNMVTAARNIRREIS